MAHLGMQINYKKKYRRNWIYCTLPIISVIILTLLAFATGYNQFSYINCIVFVQRAMLHTSLVSFIILLHCVYERFALVNSYLRYKSYIPSVLKLLKITIFSSLFVENRNQIREPKRLSVGIEKRNLIGIAKFIGRQHCFLTDIVEQINFFYAFQVFF